MSNTTLTADQRRDLRTLRGTYGVKASVYLKRADLFASLKASGLSARKIAAALADGWDITDENGKAIKAPSHVTIQRYLNVRESFTGDVTADEFYAALLAANRANTGASGNGVTTGEKAEADANGEPVAQVAPGVTVASLQKRIDAIVKAAADLSAADALAVSQALAAASDAARPSITAVA